MSIFFLILILGILLSINIKWLRIEWNKADRRYVRFTHRLILF